MPINVLAVVLIFLAIGARVLVSFRLQAQKKALLSLVEDYRAVRVDLGHERERRKAAEDLLGFYRRQLDELPRKIAEAQEELERLEKEEEEEEKKEEGEEGKSEEEKKEDRHEIRIASRGPPSHA